MSAVLADELVVSGPTSLRQVRVLRSPADLDLPRPAGVVGELRPSSAGLAGVPPQARRQGSAWRLTDRGIAVVLGLLVSLFVTGVVVLVTAFLAVSDAPPQVPAGASAVVGLVR